MYFSCALKARQACNVMSCKPTGMQTDSVNECIACSVVPPVAIGFQFINAPYSVLESAGGVTITVQMIGDTRIPVTADVATNAISAEGNLTL